MSLHRTWGSNSWLLFLCCLQVISIPLQIGLFLLLINHWRKHDFQSTSWTRIRRNPYFELGDLWPSLWFPHLPPAVRVPCSWAASWKLDWLEYSRMSRRCVAFQEVLPRVGKQAPSLVVGLKQSDNYCWVIFIITISGEMSSPFCQITPVVNKQSVWFMFSFKTALTNWSHEHFAG